MEVLDSILFKNGFRSLLEILIEFMEGTEIHSESGLSI